MNLQCVGIVLLLMLAAGAVAYLWFEWPKIRRFYDRP
jgi:hypothetical protein